MRCALLSPAFIQFEWDRFINRGSSEICVLQNAAIVGFKGVGNAREEATKVNDELDTPVNLTVPPILPTKPRRCPYL
jgi:hypothetical protein